MAETSPILQMQERIERLLELMGFSPSIEVRVDAEKKETLFCIHLEKDQHYLIGKHGANLEALQQLLRGAERKILGESRSLIDVNHYFRDRKEHLQKRVRTLVDEASGAEQSIELWPMSSFERRVVHELFLNDEEFSTESAGRGGERRITIRRNQSNSYGGS